MLQHKTLMNLVDLACCLVFLDLEWPGSARRRLQIQLRPNSRIGEQFLQLCTGQHGPTLTGTRLLEVYDYGCDGQYITGGDYDGKGGVPLLKDLQKEDRRTSTEGDVFMERGLESTVFGIVTGHDRYDWPNKFGWVVQGLDIVKEAAKLNCDITKVNVVDCGVVLIL